MRRVLLGQLARARAAGNCCNTMRSITCIIGRGTIRITLLKIWCCSIPRATGNSTPCEEDELPRRVLRGALVLLERGAGKLARSVLRGPGSSNAPRLPDANRKMATVDKPPYDATHCCIHDMDLIEGESRLVYGFGITIFDGNMAVFNEAWKTKFYYSRSCGPGGCSIAPGRPQTEKVMYCPACREAEKQFRVEHATRNA